MTDSDRPKAIITGSDSGIGRATAVALADQGFDVGITWHQDEEGAAGTADDVAARERGAIPLGRPGDAREVASVIASWPRPGPPTSPARPSSSTAGCC